MNNHDELMNFFEVLTTLRHEYAQSDDNCKLAKISTLAQVAVEVIKCGKIPGSFQLTHVMPYNPTLLIAPVEELFTRLKINLILFDRGHTFNNNGDFYYVTFSTTRQQENSTK